MVMAQALTLTTLPKLSATTHAMLLVGVHGHGAEYEALLTASTVAEREQQQTLQRADNKTGISIEQVRDLYTATRSKSGGKKRVWIIESADTMSRDAQNAFLKLLEEPPADVLFILCVSDEYALLPTIRSRTQVVHASPLLTGNAKAYLQAHNITPELASQLVFLADSSATELEKLVNNPAYQAKQLDCAATAKHLISDGLFEKISSIHHIANDREQVLTVLRLTLKMLTTLAPRNAHQKASIVQLHGFLEAYERISNNANTRIQLLRAVHYGL